MASPQAGLSWSVWKTHLGLYCSKTCQKVWLNLSRQLLCFIFYFMVLWVFKWLTVFIYWWVVWYLKDVCLTVGEFSGRKSILINIKALGNNAHIFYSWENSFSFTNILSLSLKSLFFVWSFKSLFFINLIKFRRFFVLFWNNCFFPPQRNYSFLLWAF